MSFNTFGKLFRFSTWGESHGPAIGCIVDGCPPNISIKEQDIQIELDKRKPGQSKFTTQRKEDDKVKILSGVFEGKTTGTPISLIIYNKDMRSKDYGNIKDKFRPGHADITYQNKYGIRDYRALKDEITRAHEEPPSGEIQQPPRVQPREEEKESQEQHQHQDKHQARSGRQVRLAPLACRNRPMLHQSYRRFRQRQPPQSL